jgi:hypothetical protein
MTNFIAVSVILILLLVLFQGWILPRVYQQLERNLKNYFSRQEAILLDMQEQYEEMSKRMTMIEDLLRKKGE